MCIRDSFYSYGCAGTTNAIPWRFPVNVAYTETMDGTSVYSFTDAGVGGYTYSTATNGPLCNSAIASFTYQYGSDFANDHWNYLNSYQYYDSAANLLYSEQRVQSQRQAGDVTYFSNLYQCRYWNAPPYCNYPPANYYTWNSSGQSTFGTLIPVGSTWVPSVATQDAGGNIFSGSISVPLSSYQNTFSQPNSCNTYGPDGNGYTYYYCRSSNYNFAQIFGAVSN